MAVYKYYLNQISKLRKEESLDDLFACCIQSNSQLDINQKLDLKNRIEIKKADLHYN